MSNFYIIFLILVLLGADFYQYPHGWFLIEDTHTLQELQTDPPNIQRYQGKFKPNYLNKAYLKSGYDIGHLVPADDFPGPDTFQHKNARPQLPSLNRTDWRLLEQTLQKQKGRTVTVPIDSEHKLSNLVSIPDYFLKITKDVNYLADNKTGQIITISDRERHKLIPLLETEVQEFLGE